MKTKKPAQAHQGIVLNIAKGIVMQAQCAAA